MVPKMVFEGCQFTILLGFQDGTPWKVLVYIHIVALILCKMTLLKAKGINCFVSGQKSLPTTRGLMVFVKKRLTAKGNLGSKLEDHEML